jgi:group I intron endonuclease
MYKGYVYRHWHVNEDDVEKSYVGQTITTLTKRWDKGKGYTKTRKKDGNLAEFANAINKYGWDNFNHDILLIIECETLEELVFWLDAWEKYYIEKYDSFYNGYNGTTGGRNGYIVSEETKQKHSEAQTERHANMSEDEKKQHNEAIKQTWANKSDEAKRQFSEKMSEATKQARANMSEDEKKQHNEAIKQGWANRSEEEKKQLSEKRSEIQTERMANMSEEEKKQRSEKISEAQKGDKNPRATKVICLETQQVFTTIKEAQEWFGISSSGNITLCCRGKRKSCGKHPVTGERLHWMYYKDYLKLQNKENTNNN